MKAFNEKNKLWPNAIWARNKNEVRCIKVNFIKYFQLI